MWYSPANPRTTIPAFNVLKLELRSGVVQMLTIIYLAVTAILSGCAIPYGSTYETPVCAYTDEELSGI